MVFDSNFINGQLVLNWLSHFNDTTKLTKENKTAAKSKKYEIVSSSPHKLQFQQENIENKIGNKRLRKI